MSWVLTQNDTERFDGGGIDMCSCRAWISNFIKICKTVHHSWVLDSSSCISYHWRRWRELFVDFVRQMAWKVSLFCSSWIWKKPFCCVKTRRSALITSYFTCFFFSYYFLEYLKIYSIGNFCSYCVLPVRISSWNNWQCRQLNREPQSFPGYVPKLEAKKEKEVKTITNGGKILSQFNFALFIVKASSSRRRKKYIVVIRAGENILCFCPKQQYGWT